MPTGRHVKVLACLLLMMTAGCGAFGAVAYKLKGADPVPAQYLLAGTAPIEKGQPLKRVLVVAEDYNAGNDQSVLDGDRLARMVTRHMRAHVKDIELVNAEQAGSLRSRRPKEYPGMSVAEIGRELEADLVVHVRSLNVSLMSTPGSDIRKGRGGALVRVVDVHSGHVIWPQVSTEGASVGHETDYISGRDVEASRRVKTTAMEGLADQIAKLFYTWRPEEGIKQR